tara:strand:+ start:226 stop:414 length:189 start_codon:yes stop_codon:yes gene_type:complete
MHAVFKSTCTTGPNVKIIFLQADLVAKSLADYLKRHPDKLVVQTSSKFITAGDPMKVMQKAA